MNINVSGTDNIVGEYLIYRGFTQTFQSLEQEKSRDRTKRFEVSKIVDTIFANLVHFEIEQFISFWDFLNKRFFFHLDSEHLHICGVLKVDLLKFYLVNAIKTKNKDKVAEFFAMYSHEILAEQGSFIPGNLRGWFVLPYMDEPEKDPEFSVFFAQRWTDLLKITVHNFLSVVLSSAPPPKLLLLERWFRSEAQQEIRAQLKQASHQVETLQNCLLAQEERLQNMRSAVRSVVALLHKVSVASPTPRRGLPGNDNNNSDSTTVESGDPAATKGGGGNTAGSNPMERGQSHSGKSSSSGASGTSIGLFETDEEADSRRTRAKELGQAVVRAANECVSKSAAVHAMSKDDKMKELLGKQASRLFFGRSIASAGGMDIHETGDRDGSGGGGGGNNLVLLEMELVRQINDWIAVLTLA